jgi:hypothetical protein
VEFKLLDFGGRSAVVKTSGAPRLMAVTAWVWKSTASALGRFTSTVRPIVWSRVITNGNGGLAITDVAGPPLKLDMLPGSQPISPCTCEQDVIAGSEKVTTKLVYVPGGTDVERARKALSLWSLLKSTSYGSELRATFTDSPVDAISEIPPTVARKERRLNGAGGSGVARSKTTNVGFPVSPVLDLFGWTNPLQA